MKRPCPRCNEPVEIPQPLPEQISCAKCGAVMRFKKKPAGEESAPASQTPQAAAQSAPQQGPAAQPAATQPSAIPDNLPIWYFARQGADRTGPCTLEDLKQRIGRGELSAQDRVWRAGFEAWKPVQEVPELVGSLPSAAGQDDFQVPVADSVSPGAVKAAPPTAAADQNPFQFTSSPSPAAVAPTPVATQPFVPASAATLPAAAPMAAADPLTQAPLPEPAAAPAPRKPKTSGFLYWMHTKLPKPVLFGLYGATGALLAVLLLGEIVWRLVHPDPAVIEPLKVAVSPTVTVYPATGNHITVKIARSRFKGPVHIAAANVPQGVEIPQVTIPEEDSEIVIPVRTTADVRPEVRQVELHFKAVNDEAIKVLETVRLAIETTPPRLQLTVSPAVVVYAGFQNRIGFNLFREHFTGPLRLEVLDLPPGVSIPLIPLAESQRDGVLDIVAAPTTKPGRYPMEVEVHSLLNHRISARARFELNVEPRPGDLQLAVSSEIKVYPNARNKFTVKTAQPKKVGNIRIEVEGLPPDLEIAPITIPEGSTDGEMIVSADKISTAPDTGTVYNLRLKAVTLDPEKVPGTLPFQVIVQPPPPTVQVAVSPKVSAYPGGKASFGVKIARNRFKGPVTVSVLGAGKGGKGVPFTKAPTVTIPDGETEGQIELAVALTALNFPLKYSTHLPVVARRIEGVATEGTDEIEVEVLAPPSDLSLTVSPEVEVYQGGKCFFTAKIARTGFLDPVMLKFPKLPTGVTIKPVLFPNGVSDVVVQGEAAPDAPTGKFKVEVEASPTRPSPDGKTPVGTSDFTLIVKENDPSKRPPLDIVFVLDVSKSMDPQIAGIRDGVAQFVGKLNDKKLDAQIGLVAFRDVLFDKDDWMEVLKFDGTKFTKDYKFFSKEVGKLKAKGGGDDPESSLDGILEAAKYPFRPKSLKFFVLVTDADYKDGKNLTDIKEAQTALRAKGVDQVHFILPKSFYARYEPLWGATKSRGKWFDLTGDARTNAAAFAKLLPELSDEIVKITPVGDVAAKPMDPPPPPKAKDPPSLAGEKAPEPPAEKKVAAPPVRPPATPTAGKVEAIQAAPPSPPVAPAVRPPEPSELPTLQGVQSDKMYADKDRLQLLIAVALWTAILAGGIALMLVAAQKRYLTQMRLSFRESTRAFLAGMAAGLCAGTIGQWFFQTTSGTAGWSIISRLISWALLGGLIGAGMSFFVPNLKWRRAALGGCIGGFVGAAGFAVLAAIAHDSVGRWIGALLLGLCIGLMVALAEVAFRRYWLEVAFGEREIRTVNLGPDVVAVGGDEKQVRVYVPEAPARALGFRVDRNKVFCEDFPAGRTTEMAPGDTRPLARARLRVCSASSANPTGITLQLVLPRNVSLIEGMPLMGDDIPGLDPQGGDGVVALVSKRPTTPTVYLLRNRSKQTWHVTQADGTRREVGPGLSIELTDKCEVDFGLVKGTLDQTESSNNAPSPV